MKTFFSIYSSDILPIMIGLFLLPVISVFFDKQKKIFAKLESLLWVFMFLFIPSLFINAIIVYTKAPEFYIAANLEGLSYLGLSIALPFLISQLLNLIRNKTEDKGRGGTSYYSGPHFFTQAEIFGDKHFKMSANEKWKKYYRTFTLLSIGIPLVLITKENPPLYMILIAAILAPISFLAPQLKENNFLVPEKVIDLEYEERSLNMHGITNTVKMKKLNVSTASLIMDFLFIIVLPILAILFIFASNPAQWTPFWVFMYLESILLFIGAFLFNIFSVV